MRWYRKAAKQGNAAGEEGLGTMFAGGMIVQHDDEQAGRGSERRPSRAMRRRNTTSVRRMNMGTACRRTMSSLTCGKASLRRRNSMLGL